VSARSLAEWLEFIGRQHPDAIALGLDRLRAVAERTLGTHGLPWHVSYRVRMGIT